MGLQWGKSTSDPTVGSTDVCLAVPGQVTAIHGEGFSLMGRVDFGGVAKDVCLAFVPEVEVGQYVIVHVGFAISTVDAEEAHQVFDYLREMGDLAELEPGEKDEIL